MKTNSNFKNAILLIIHSFQNTQIGIGSTTSQQSLNQGSYQSNFQQKKGPMLYRPQSTKYLSVVQESKTFYMQINNSPYNYRIKDYDQVKKIKDMTEYTKDKIRENFELYEKGQIDKELLKRNLKHKLYLPINEKEIDYAISQNRFDYRNIDNPKFQQSSPNRKSQQNNYSDMDIIPSMTLKNYRSVQEGNNTSNGNGVSSKESCIKMIQKFIDGGVDKANLLRNLKKIDLQTEQLFEVKDLNNDRFEPNTFQHLGTKILTQFRPGDIRSRENKEQNIKMVIERCVTEENKNYNKAYNQTDNVAKLNYVDQEQDFIRDELRYDFANGQIKIKTRKTQDRCPSACKTNGDIITWQGQERNVDRDQAVKERLLKVKRMKSSQMQSSEQIKTHLSEEKQYFTPSSATSKKKNHNQSEYLTYNNQFSSSGSKPYFRDSETTSCQSSVSSQSKDFRNQIEQKTIKTRNLQSLFQFQLFLQMKNFQCFEREFQQQCDFIL